MKRKPPKNDAQIDLFAPAFGEIASRDGIDLMEFPFFSLSKKKRFEPIEYENEARGVSITVSGGKPHGIATIWDRDILMWCISQVVEARDRGEKPKQTIFFHPYHLLKGIRRGNGNRQYLLLEKSLARLANTMIYTTIRRNGKAANAGFHWLEKITSATENMENEGVSMWSVKLSDWLYEAALNDRLILTIDDDYFLLTGGRERWLYLIARKHGGYQEHGFTIAMRTLHEKSATSEQYKFWAHEIRQIVQANELPGYHLASWYGEDGEEYINFTRRSQLSYSHPAYRTDFPRDMKKRLPKLS